jgi:hypothetical protein
MPTRLAIHAHLAVDEVETRYRRAKDPVARRHWQVIWLLAPGRASAPVGAVTGYTGHGIRTSARRSNQHGPTGLEDRRQRHPGAAGLLAAALKEPPPRWRRGDRAQSGGLDDGHAGPPRAPPTGVGDAATRGLDHHSAAAAPRERSSPRAGRREKTLPAVVRTGPQASPPDVVERWTTDPHRLGRKPILRRVWSPRGQRPAAGGPHRYQWGYLYGLVPPGSGRTWGLLLPTVSGAAFTLARTAFAQAVGAGWHVSAHVHVPAGGH